MPLCGIKKLWYMFEDDLLKIDASQKKSNTSTFVSYIVPKRPEMIDYNASDEYV